MPTPITIQDQVYEYHSWELLGREIFNLAQQIIKSGEKFDRVVALAKGGLTFGRSLVDYLDIEDLSSVQIEFYTGIGKTAKTPVIKQSLPVSINNERILVFDDVVDKGDTMQLAVEYLQYHGVKSITTSTLVVKPWSSFKPDYVAHTTEAWIIFANESRETILLLRDTWRKKGESDTEIAANLVKIGLPQAEVEFFMKIQ